MTPSAGLVRRNGCARTAVSRTKEVRVAIYTRQSVSDDAEFGSLEAQREAVEAYVLSQKHQAWVALSDPYDDSGFSGSTTDRPAFQRLMRAVEAGEVDVVAVYKIDRLSRSLHHFTQLMMIFQRHGVSFISVTQQFSTSTSVGRMTLNIVAAFAEYEREMICERTRDKIVAARRRGMWTGGTPVLGYEVRDKRLVINDHEAEQVRAAFDTYLDLGSLLRAGPIQQLSGPFKSHFRRFEALIEGVEMLRFNRSRHRRFPTSLCLALAATALTFAHDAGAKRPSEDKPALEWVEDLKSPPTVEKFFSFNGLRPTTWTRS